MVNKEPRLWSDINRLNEKEAQKEEEGNQLQKRSPLTLMD
jgi:hypothetical protein